MNNKYLILGGIFIYLVIITLVADSLAITSSGIETPFLEETGGMAVTGYLTTFWNMISFNINLPPVVTLLFIYPPLLILLYMVIEIIKDLIPFT